MPYLRVASVALLCATIGTRSAANEFINASDDHVENTIQFSPLQMETCRQVAEASATILSYISPIDGQASLTVDWGDGKNQTYSTDAIKVGPMHTIMLTCCPVCMKSGQWPPSSN